MISPGRMAAIAIVALGLGFVGGAWFISSGYGYSLVPVPLIPSKPSMPGQLKARKAPGPLALSLPKAASSSVSSAGLMPRSDRTDLLPSPGCDWEIEPRPLLSGSSWHWADPDRAIGGYWMIDPARGGFRYLLVQSIRRGGPEMDLRPVFFDEEANRMVPHGKPLGSSRGSEAAFFMAEFLFEPFQAIDVSKAVYFAVERVKPEAARLQAEAAQEEGVKKGVAILPEPRLGQPYPFDLLDADGKPIRSEDYKGKVLVVAFLGPGGFDRIAPVMAKKIRESYKPEDVAFIGISFDATIEGAKETFASSGLDGSLVVIPNDPTARRLWADGSKVERVPKFLVVDGEGVLRFDCDTSDLQDRVDILFGRAKRPPFTMILPGNPAIRGIMKAPSVPPISPGPSPKPQ